MPPKARQNAGNLAKQQGRIILAISTIQKHEIRNIREADISRCLNALRAIDCIAEEKFGLD